MLFIEITDGKANVELTEYGTIFMSLKNPDYFSPTPLLPHNP